MASRSATIYGFHRGEAGDDGSCLYTSFRYVNGNLNTINNQQLRSWVADRIRKNKNLHLAVLQSGTQYKTVENYCTAIEKHNLWGGEPEIRALVLISKILIRLVSKRKTSQGNYVVNILNYGEDIESFKECVYILYDEENKHYDPLYIIINEETQERQTIFQHDDPTIIERLYKFIHEELHVLDDRFIRFEFNTKSSSATEVLEVDDPIILDKLRPNAHENNPVKRKLPNYLELSLAKIVDPALLPSSPIPINTEEVIDQSPTIPKCNTDENSIEMRTNQSINIEQHLQTDFSHDIQKMVQGSTVESQRMRFEIEPTLNFRGRTRSEYKPKKSLKRNGQRAETNKPRHFADRNGKNVLNLLVPDKYLFPECEYKLKVYLITPEINGCSYVNRYFKFQVHPTNKNILDVNPIEVSFDMRELKNYREGIKQIPLRLVVLMHKNPELMQTDQPLETFYSSENGSPITEIYTKHREFKNAYHLNDVRFAVTLLEKRPGQDVFHRCDHGQYISEISTQKGAYQRLKK